MTKLHGFSRCANQISIGDEVLVHQNNEMIFAEVINVSSLMMQGKYEL